MDLGLQGKVALVTASSRGLGRATAQALSEDTDPHRSEENTGPGRAS